MSIYTPYFPKTGTESQTGSLTGRITNFWQRITNIGLPPHYDDIERKHIELANKACFLLVAIASVNILAGLILDIPVICMSNLILLFVLGLCVRLIYHGHYVAGRVLGVFAFYDMLMLSMILSGSASGLKDELILTSVIPILLFGKKHLRWVLFFMGQSLLYYFLYDFFKYDLDRFALPHDLLHLLNMVVAPVKVVTCLMAMYMIFNTLSDTESEFEAREKALTEQRNYYFDMLDSMPIHFVTYDRDLRYTYVNRGACRDKSMSEWIIGKTDMDYVKYRNLDPALAQQRMEQLTRSAAEKKVIEVEEEFINRMGEYHATLKGTIPMFDDLTGELREYFCYSIDITARKEAEKKLQETVEALSRVNGELKQFGYVVSHDLKTPLRNISTYLSILKRNTNLSADNNELIDHAVKSVKHMNGMIQDIFMYSTSDHATMQREDVEPAALIDTICDHMESVLRERCAEVRIETDLPLLYMNPIHALHLFSNLITNAIKYNESERPLVVIGADERGFYIRDNGIGIKAEHQAQIFELFKRLHSEDKYEGTGVGLSLCLKIVKLYGGGIDVQSAIGMGSTFRFALPGAATAMRVAV